MNNRKALAFAGAFHFIYFGYQLLFPGHLRCALLRRSFAKAQSHTASFGSLIINIEPLWGSSKTILFFLFKMNPFGVQYVGAILVVY